MRFMFFCLHVSSQLITWRWNFVAYHKNAQTKSAAYVSESETDHSIHKIIIWTIIKTLLVTKHKIIIFLCICTNCIWIADKKNSNKTLIIFMHIHSICKHLSYQNTFTWLPLRWINNEDKQHLTWDFMENRESLQPSEAINSGTLKYSSKPSKYVIIRLNQISKSNQ